jgi:hypothetical protein
METLVTISREASELIQFAHTFLPSIQALCITSAEQAQGAVDFTKKIKDCLKAIDEARKGYTKPLDDQKAIYMDTFRPATDSLEKAEKVLKAEIAAWTAAEAKRAAAIEAERRLIEAAEQANVAELLRQAELAAVSGDYARAEELEDQAIAASTEQAQCPVVTLEPTKPKGASVRTIWRCRVVNPALGPREFMIPDVPALDAFAKATKGKSTVAGCEFWSEESVSIR